MTGLIGGVSLSLLKEFYFPLPPLLEQEKIVAFLDYKTDLIDKLLRIKQEKIGLLKQKRTALINEAVTKGVNPNVTLKDSGTEWIGEIPVHWEVNQIKRSIKLLTDYDSNGSFSTIKNNVNRVVVEEEKFAWMVRATDIEQQKNLIKANNDLVWVDDITFKFLSKSSLEEGDLLIAKRGEIGKLYLMPKVSFPSTLGPNMYLVRLDTEKLHPSFAYYYFTIDLGKNQLQLRNKSTAIGALYKDDFKDIPIIYPPKKEQLQIIKFIKEHTQEIDALVALEEQKINSLKEYRQALISEAVTGKIDVRDWQEPKTN